MMDSPAFEVLPCDGRSHLLVSQRLGHEIENITRKA